MLIEETVIFWSLVGKNARLGLGLGLFWCNGKGVGDDGGLPPFIVVAWFYQNGNICRFRIAYFTADQVGGLPIIGRGWELSASAQFKLPGNKATWCWSGHSPGLSSIFTWEVRENAKADHMVLVRGTYRNLISVVLFRSIPLGSSFASKPFRRKVSILFFFFFSSSSNWSEESSFVH